MSNKRFHQGRYTVKNKDKYLDDPNNAIYRSSWERRVCVYLDKNPEIIGWAIEPAFLVIPYTSPKDNRTHRYFIDFFVVAKDENLGRKVTLIEVKPKKETLPPRKGGKKTKNRYLNEVLTYSVNQAKWNAAKKLCDQKGWNFLVITEKELFKR